MPWGKRSRIWDVDRGVYTPEQVFLHRRAFLKSMGLTGLGLMVPGCGVQLTSSESTASDDTLSESLRPPAESAFMPGLRNTTYTLDRPITEETVAASDVRFEEFHLAGTKTWREAQKLTTRPWTLEIDGLVAKPMTIDIDDLIRMMPVEERLCRHRCVETWAMAVPWSGFELRVLIEMTEPLSSAKYVHFVSFYRPDEAERQQDDLIYHWPYSEGLTIEEATNELCFMATGIYGHDLPKQHGGPLRVVVPWKYGYKSAKSIVRIELTDTQPPSFWNEFQSTAYGFVANVNPDHPHPFWSQTHEVMLGTGERIETQLYNGYADYVAHMYTGDEF